ncbi:MAG: GMC oxidoreductase [Gammaproteobacteria bacterium]|nr:GMC oxidoreductase [Gammaproteobacteria bacterium]
MEKLLIVGSGASGVHFAYSVLQKGYEVVMLDVGHEGPKAINAGDSIVDLKANLSDPAEYFLGRTYEALEYLSSGREYYGLPPSKSHILSNPAVLGLEARGFEPLVSFAKGGFAEAWTAGVYPFNEGEFREFPFRYNDIEPYYNEVARRIGVTGTMDDLARFFPLHDHLMESLHLDEHSQQLLALYAKHKRYLNTKLRCYLGRSRVATLSHGKGERNGCTYRGRCLWGCPVGALYTPSMTLKECERYPNFRYLPHVHVSHFNYNSEGRIVSVVGQLRNEHGVYEAQADKFILAAGTLSSSRIFMDTIFKRTGDIITLPGLMDNRQILMPFVNRKMIGKRYSPESYQYHQIAVGIESEQPERYIHGQITTLKAAPVHSILHQMPFDLRTAIFVFRNVRAGLGVVNVNLPERRREENYLTLKKEDQTGQPTLIIKYAPAIEERSLIKRTVRTMKRALWSLGCIVPPTMTHVRPMGASVHYAGTIPMSPKRAPHTTSRYCQSHDFENLYIVDGTTFPFLPAKNITFSLMANAARVADTAF